MSEDELRAEYLKYKEIERVYRSCKYLAKDFGETEDGWFFSHTSLVIEGYYKSKCQELSEATEHLQNKWLREESEWERMMLED